MELITERPVRETARDQAYRILKKAIIMLELEPGTMVSENELAVRTGFSRTPVREALIELSKTGIVEIYPQKGNLVTKIDYNMVEEARFIRLVLESAVVELACDTAAEEDFLSLAENLNMQNFSLENSNHDKLLELDNQFHQQLFVIAGKQQTYHFLDTMSVHFDRVRALSLNTVKEIKIVTDHQAILDAMKDRDKALARQHMEKHLTRYKIDEQLIREKYPSYIKNGRLDYGDGGRLFV